MDDILSQIIAYAPDKIDTELKAAALVQGSRNMDQEPRNMYNQGSSVDHAVRTIDPVQDSGNKIEEVLKAYGIYQGNRKGGRMSFKKFFELFAPENFATGGSAGQLVSNTVDGSRPGYSGLGGDKIPKSVLNKGAQYFYKVDYDNLKDDKELTKEKKRSKIYSKINDYYKRTGEYKFVVKTQETPLSKTDQAKILKEYPEAKFGPKRKYGFAPTDPEYQSVFKYVKDNFKTPYEGGMFKSLPKYSQKELIEAFPEVDFNFDRNIEFSTKGSQFSKYGVPVTHPKYAKISKYFAKSKPWKYKFDLRSPEGWMMSQMERASAQGNTEYKPITKNGKPISKGNPMIGIEHNGEKYNMKTITDHPDFNNTKKYWNIADKTSRKYLTEFNNLATLLPEGFDPAKIQLNDLLQFIGNKDGVKGLNRAKRAIELHHEYGVKNKTTGSYQLLRQDVNLLANKANNLIKKGDLSNIEKGAAEALAKGVRLNVDGVKYGPEKVSATGDIKNILTGAETELKSFTKKDFKKFASELEKLGCGRAAGGRILFSKGTPGASLTECGKKGIARFMDDLKKGNYSKASLNILKGGGNLIKNIVNPMELLKLRNLIGPGALGLMAAFEAGVITDDVIRQGTPLNESLANNWLTKTFLPYTKQYAQAKNLLESGTVPSNMKKYVQDVVTFNDALMDIKGIENRKDSRLVDDTGYGMIDGSSVYTQKQEQKDDAALMKKLGTLTEDVYTPGSAKALEMRSLQDENEATRMAKKEFSPIFGFDKLKDVRTPGYTGYDYIPDEQPVDLRPITYEDAEYEDKKLPLGLEQLYMNKLNLKPRDSLKNYFFKDGPKKKIVYGERKQDFAEKPISILEDLTNDYNKFERQKEASKYPGYYGANEKFMEGGIASLNVKK